MLSISLTLEHWVTCFGFAYSCKGAERREDMRKNMCKERKWWGQLCLPCWSCLCTSCCLVSLSFCLPQALNLIIHWLWPFLPSTSITLSTNCNLDMLFVACDPLTMIVTSTLPFVVCKLDRAVSHPQLWPHHLLLAWPWPQLRPWRWICYYLSLAT